VRVHVAVYPGQTLSPCVGVCTGIRKLPGWKVNAGAVRAMAYVRDKISTLGSTSASAVTAGPVGAAAVDALLHEAEVATNYHSASAYGNPPLAGLCFLLLLRSRRCLARPRALRRLLMTSSAVPDVLQRQARLACRRAPSARQGAHSARTRFSWPFSASCRAAPRKARQTTRACCLRPWRRVRGGSLVRFHTRRPPLHSQPAEFALCGGWVGNGSAR